MSARAFDRALDAEELLSEATLRRIQGMSAVATLVLSRGRPATLTELALARDRLRASITRGNRGPESAAYLAELHLRTYDRSGDPKEIEDGLATVDAADGANDSASLRLTACELGLRLITDPCDRDLGHAFARVAAELARAKSFSYMEEHDRVRLVLVEAILAAQQRRSAKQAVLADFDWRGAPLPFGLRARLVQLRAGRSSQFLPLAREVGRCLEGLLAEPSPPRLALELFAGTKSLEARVLGQAKPLEAAAAMREGIEARVRALDGAPASRMSLWRLGSEYRDLFQLTGDINAAVAAAERFAEAAALDFSWPVPLVNLAELAAEERLAIALGGRAEPLLAQVAAQDAEGLFAVAAKRSLSNREFEHRVLGGRSDAYVMQDTPGLLASALVFKPMSTLQATRERQTAAHLGSVLIDEALTARFTCIRSLAIVPLQADDPRRTRQIDCLHVLGREEGTSLANLALRAARRGGAVDDVTTSAVVDFLAVFHASFPAADAKACVAARRDWRLSLRTWLRTLLGNEMALTLRDTWERSLVVGLPVFPKRDAHPGNWLVTVTGGVVALDLECAAHLPVLLEVAQLLEDGPCLPVNDRGWAQRDAACRRYLSGLHDHGAEVMDVPDVRTVYEPFAAQRATLFLSRPDKFDPVQVRHSRDLLVHLAEKAGSDDLREYCGQVLSGTPETSPEVPRASSIALSITDDKRQRLSRAVAYLLRHHPEQADLELDAEGWTSVGGVVAALKPNLSWLNEQKFEAMVLHPQEKRYEMRGGRVRALYGHSLPMAMPPVAAEVPKQLFHGTSWSNLSRILSSGQGLRPMRRNAVHLSSDVATARGVGRRHGTPVVLGMRTADLLAAGVQARRAADGVWLAPSVPAPLLYVVADQML